jgi:hypothetical protein
VLLVPQLIVGLFVCSIWNPLTVKTTVYETRHWLPSHALLLWWNVRDLVASDFVALPLLVLCPLLWFLRRSSALLRAPAAVAVYVVVISALAATQVEKAGNAELRYLPPVLPICIGVEVLAVWAFEQTSAKLKTTMLALAVFSLLVEPTGAQGNLQWKSPAFSFYRELVQPQVEPYTPVIQWINANVPPRASIYVQPTWMMYPLMLRAPGAIYAWQLNDPPTSPEFAGLPDVFFVNRVPPDYLIAFGPFHKEMGQTREQLRARGVRYEPAATLHVYWKDLYRPERIWRSFRTTPPLAGSEIYIFRRVK